MRTQATPFNELVQFKAPEGFSAAVTAAARRDHTSMAEFLRRTVIARLDKIGLSLDPTDQNPANAVEPVETEACTK